MSKLLIAGDIFPVDENIKLFVNGDAEQLLGSELFSMFKNADYRIANLEGPLTNEKRPIQKSGPALKADPMSIRGLDRIGFDALSLANNHILDYGSAGYHSTVKQLVDNNINYFGAGINIEEAKKPLIIDFDGLKVGVYACAEYEFTIATENTSGANPFDALYVYDDVTELRKKVDYLIVLYHGMKELYRYPAPYVMKRCRRFIDKGADLVLCQHSHCIGCFEKYANGQILYGQGDFCFCSGSSEERKTGLLVEVDLPEKKVKYIPIEKKEFTIQLAKESSKDIISGLNERSEQIKDQVFVEHSYNVFAEKMIESYLLQSLGRVGGWLLRFKKTKLIEKLFRRYHYLDLLNSIRCEAHSDLFIKGLLTKGDVENENN